MDFLIHLVGRRGIEPIALNPIARSKAKPTHIIAVYTLVQLVVSTSMHHKHKIYSLSTLKFQLPMPLKPLEVLKKGLKILQDQVEAKKEKLQAQLHAQKSISSLDART